MENSGITKSRWSLTAMIILIVSTIILSPIGIIVGAVNFQHIERRNQTYILISVGIVMSVLWIIHFSGHHHH